MQDTSPPDQEGVATGLAYKVIGAILLGAMVVIHWMSRDGQLACLYVVMVTIMYGILVVEHHGPARFALMIWASLSLALCLLLVVLRVLDEDWHSKVKYVAVGTVAVMMLTRGLLSLKTR